MSGPRYFDEPHEAKSPDYFANPRAPKTGSWRQHEEDVAARTGEERVVGSGNQVSKHVARPKPGDTMGTEHLRQLKETRGAGLSVSAKEVEKIVRQALDMNRRPAIELRMLGAKPPVPQDWVCVPALDYDDLVERARGG